MPTSDGKPVLSRALDRQLKSVYAGFVFLIRFFRELRYKPVHWNEIAYQCYSVGYKSLPLISLTGFVVGIVFTKQSRPSLSSFGATSWLPSLISIAVIRALAPLVTALICAGKVGSNIGAELGSMKVTEQIDAMEVSAINPYKYLVVTRVIACTLMLPILMMYSACIGMVGAYLNVHSNEATSFITFINNAFSSLVFLDIWAALIKSLAFGFTIGLVACSQGFNATKGTQGVGKAANAAVVISMFLIFLEEIIIVQIINWFRYF